MSRRVHPTKPKAEKPQKAPVPPEVKAYFDRIRAKGNARGMTPARVEALQKAHLKGGMLTAPYNIQAEVVREMLANGARPCIGKQFAAWIKRREEFADIHDMVAELTSERTRWDVTKAAKQVALARGIPLVRCGTFADPNAL